MIRTRSLALATLLALLAGCATREGYTARLAPLVGRGEADVVAALGVPAAIHEVEGRRFLQYEERRVVSYAGAGYGGVGFGRRAGLGLGYGLGYGPGYGFGPVAETRGCDVTFELRQARVVGFVTRGNDCLAVPARPAA